MLLLPWHVYSQMIRYFQNVNQYVFISLEFSFCISGHADIHDGPDGCNISGFDGIQRSLFDARN